jgi:uncharacterized repeat protein (TIGR04076 family)
VKVEEWIAGHRVGEKFDLTLFSEEAHENNRTMGVCVFFYDAIFLYLVALQFGRVFPWEIDRDKFLAGCPDGSKVLIAMRRIRQ